MGTIQGVSHQVLVGIVKSYTESQFGANGTHGNVSRKGNTAKVFDLGDGTWGYADTAHGEIEVIPANNKSGTTSGVRSMIFSLETTTTGENVTSLVEVTGIRALVQGKTHAYTINGYC